MGLIPEEIVAQILDRCDIVETISSYVPLKRAGRNFKALCPFHPEKTPSFMVNPDKQIFHCFGCGVGGNVVSFVMKQERIEFPEALRYLAQKANIVIPITTGADETAQNLRQAIFKVNALAGDFFHRALLSDKSTAAEKARDYLKKRAVNLIMVKSFKLGFALDSWDDLLKHLQGKNINLSLMEKAGVIIPRENKEGYYDRFRNRIIFPILDSRGECRAFGARALEKESTAKYINSPETILYTKGQHLYGFHLAKQAIGEKDEVVVVEGYMDCLTSHQFGVLNVVASLGTALTVEQVRLLRRYTKNVVMLFDADQAGQLAMLRSLDMLLEEDMNVRVAALTEGDDPDSFIRKRGVNEFNKRIAEALSFFDYKLKFLTTQFNLKSIDGKAELAKEMLLTTAKFPDAIRKEQYLRRLSTFLAISEESLRLELKKSITTRGPRGTSHSYLEGKKNNEVPKPVERNILKLLLEEESFIGFTKGELLPSDFQDERIRSVISKIYDWFDQGKRINVGSLITSFEDDTIQKMISYLVVEDEALKEHKEKMHRDYIQRIKQEKLKLQRQGLIQEIKEAELSGNHHRLSELQQKFNELIKSS